MCIATHPLPVTLWSSSRFNEVGHLCTACLGVDVIPQLNQPGNVFAAGETTVEPEDHLDRMAIDRIVCQQLPMMGT